MTAAILKALARQNGEGERIKMGAEEMRFVLTSAETGGRFDLIERWVSPNFKSPPLPHTHTREDWAGYLMEGRLVFQLDGKVTELTAGGSLFVPRGVYFRWWNPEVTSARVLFVYTPGGFGTFFKEVFELSARKADQVHDYDKTLAGIMKLHDKYGMIRQEPKAE
ncbi:cupin domain-containing protein [Microvirga terricola]|uniref:Cupin domain-containing protein n=1 Tax=Microvirga terricola TaxID=2719797 RepID=A0ABX0V8V6_9HYPH|nr:cupin domain-containing protein [Microvirga terricola]NIX76117.1 cupin domain-containing protein [Microvirga terricola]